MVGYRDAYEIRKDYLFTITYVQVYNLRPVFEQSGWGCEFSPIPGAFFPDTPQLIKLR